LKIQNFWILISCSPQNLLFEQLWCFVSRWTDCWKWIGSASLMLAHYWRQKGTSRVLIGFVL
jgi:hypothetical protein